MSRALARDPRMIALALSVALHASLILALLAWGKFGVPAAAEEPPAPALDQAPPAQPETPAVASASAPPALAADLGPATSSGGGMTVATRAPVAGPPASAAGRADSAGEDDYLPQFRITELPVIPIKEALAKIEYPSLAARQGIEATVYLELFIDEGGTIRRIAVLKDPGYGFAEAAVAALRGLGCAPARAEGRAVAVRFRYPVRFALK